MSSSSNLSNNNNLSKNEPKQKDNASSSTNNNVVKKFNPSNNGNNNNLTPIKPKRFSAMIREIDYNAYRAYKMANDENNNNNHKSRNPKDILQNEHNPMKAPFGLKSKRFTWQTESSYNTVNELNGTLKNYSTPTSATWSELIKRSQSFVKKKNIGSSKAYNYSVMVDINSKRTLNPKSDLIGTDRYLTPKRKILHSSSTGSIANLLNKTPLEKKIRIRDKASRENGVFTTEYYTSNYFRRQKSSVDLNKLKKRGGYAGSCNIERSVDDFLYRTEDERNKYSETRAKSPMSIARRMKLNTNMSDIFNTKPEKDNIYTKNGKRQQFTFVFSQCQSQL